MKVLLFICFCVLGLLGQTSPAYAHPHAFISLHSVAVFDDANQLVAIKEHWVFDKFYTEFALQDFDPNHNGKLDHEELMMLANENLSNLKEYSYFTKIEDVKTGASFPIAKISDANSFLKDAQINMDFTVWLAAPVDSTKHTLSYRIYDPSYYIAMVHESKKAATLEGKKITACHASVMTPQPDATWLNLASSLDKNAKAPDDLGSYFAERVSIQCP